MKAASVSEIKGELKQLSSLQLIELCLRLSRYKKENKELVTYLLFEAADLHSYIQNVKAEIEGSLAAVNTNNIYFTKKGVRKTLRTTNKYIKYTGSKVAEVEILTHFCMQLKNSKIPLHKSNALTNVYKAQLKKIDIAIASLHEDLQHDYKTGLEGLTH